jgi:hypothetical protein
MSLFPYLAFLFYLHRSGKAPKLTLIGFYFLLAFVGATIPAGIYGECRKRAAEGWMGIEGCSCCVSVDRQTSIRPFLGCTPRQATPFSTHAMF